MKWRTHLCFSLYKWDRLIKPRTAGANIRKVMLCFLRLVKVAGAPEEPCCPLRSPASSTAPCRDIDWRAIAVWVTGVLPRGCSNASLHTIQSQRDPSLWHSLQPQTHTPETWEGRGPAELDQSHTAALMAGSWFCSGTQSCHLWADRRCRCLVECH